MLKNISGVIEASEVNGIYDIIVKIALDNIRALKETTTSDIRTIDNIAERARMIK
jgi:DNA-binding Lrp family transcriptional regulator